MRNNTKLKKLLQEHKLIISQDIDGQIEVIITNKETGDSHMVFGNNLSEIFNRAVTDTNRMKSMMR